MTKITGGCLCGNIRYSFEAEPISMAICNCKNCQHITGSAFATVAIIRDENFKITKGKTSVYVDQNDAGLPLERHFCGNCGSSLFNLNERRPGTVALRVGGLDDTSWVKPIASIWRDSGQAWFLEIETNLTPYPRSIPPKK